MLGLRYSDEFAHALFEEVLGMEESATYQAIVRRSRAEQARRLLVLQGERRFGPPDAATRAAIQGTGDLAQLEDLVVRRVSAGSWQDLMPLSPSRRRGRRRSGQ
jgi:hypothetical protein